MSARLPSIPARFEVLRVLGRGGFGVVFLARDQQLGRELAVKVLNHELTPELRARFEREARITAGLRHPHVVEVLDAGMTDAGTPWVAYEYVEGRPSLEVARDPASRPLLPRLGSQVASALEAAHELGLVHRDVKPENILVRGEDAVLLDFGIADVGREERLTATGLVVGTPAYMAPELLRGERPTPAADQWGLAATLWKLATGRLVYGGGEPAEVLEALQRGGWPLPPGGAMGPDLERVLRRALARDAGARFPSCAAFAEALDDVELSGAPPPVAPVDGDGATRRSLRSPVPGEATRQTLDSTPVAALVATPTAGRGRWLSTLVGVVGLGAFWIGWQAPGPRPMKPTSVAPSSEAASDPDDDRRARELLSRWDAAFGDAAQALTIPGSEVPSGRVVRPGQMSFADAEVAPAVQRLLEAHHLLFAAEGVSSEVKESRSHRLTVLLRRIKETYRRRSPASVFQLNLDMPVEAKHWLELEAILEDLDRGLRARRRWDPSLGLTLVMIGVYEDLAGMQRSIEASLFSPDAEKSPEVWILVERWFHALWTSGRLGGVAWPVQVSWLDRRVDRAEETLELGGPWRPAAVVTVANAAFLHWHRRHSVVEERAELYRVVARRLRRGASWRGEGDALHPWAREWLEKIEPPGEEGGALSAHVQAAWKELQAAREVLLRGRKREPEE